MDSPTSQVIRGVGMKVTRTRLAILDVLETNPGHLTVEQVRAEAAARLGKVSPQTVYSTLEAFSDAGIVSRTDTAGRARRYERCTGDNHHHFICRHCGSTTDVACVVGSAPCMGAELPPGFVLDEAAVIFRGYCAQCSADVSKAS
ncbi:MAG: Fur family transcriptional regulator [Candidatus Nanopelagicales bacterium]